jgi:hypothetical protein
MAGGINTNTKTQLYVLVPGYGALPLIGVLGPTDPLGRPTALLQMNTTPMVGSTLIIKNINALAIVSGTPQIIWTPDAGHKFRLLGYVLQASANTVILLEDGTGNVVIRIPSPLSANTPSQWKDFPYPGYLSTAVDNKLFIDTGASVSITGYVYGLQE